MTTKILVLLSFLVAAFCIHAAFTQQAALVLRQENQSRYWPRRGTRLSGGYRGGVWVPVPARSSFGGFRGGGPSAGK